MKAMTPVGAIPANVFDSERAIVTAGLASETYARDLVFTLMRNERLPGLRATTWMLNITGNKTARSKRLLMITLTKLASPVT